MSGPRDNELGGDRAFKEWEADLTKLERKQLPFALSLALNVSMFSSRKAVLKDYPGHFGGGINYLRRGMSIDTSNKKQKTITASIGESTGYMGQQQHGYTKQAAQGGKMAIPTKELTKRFANKSGRIKKSAWPSRLIKGYKGPVISGKRGGAGKKGTKKDPIFPMVSGGHRYIVMRKDRANRIGNGRRYADNSLIFLYVYTKTAKVKKEWKFDEVVIDEVKRIFPSQLAKRLKQAIKTAK